MVQDRLRLGLCAAAALLGAACGDPDVRFDGGSFFDAPPSFPPAPPVIESFETPVPWPVATIRGRAEGSRRIIVEGFGNPLAAAVLPDSTFCVDLEMPSPGTYAFLFFSQSDAGLLSNRSATAMVEFDPAATPIAGLTTCSGGDPAGCSGSTEICDNGRDDDCNGFVDGRDPACSTCTDDLLEPNDDANAPRLDPGRVDGLKICPGNEDYYGVFAREGDTIDVRIFFTHAAGDLDASLLDLDRSTTIVRSNTLDDDEVLTHVAAAEGQHVVRVFSASGDENTYAIDVRVTPAM